MGYSKPSKTFEEQAQLIIDRGLVGDADKILDFLKKVNYYRFSGYLYPFRDKKSDNFLPGTNFEKIKNIYLFDKELRSITLSAIEIIEVYFFRTQMVEKFSTAYDPFCYLEKENFQDSMTTKFHRKMLAKIENSLEITNEEGIRKHHIRRKANEYLPLWMVVETLTYGQLSNMFKYIEFDLLALIAESMDLKIEVMLQWLHSLLPIRNICAHHGRLWNKPLIINPRIPSKKYHPGFHEPSILDNTHYFGAYAVLSYLLRKIDFDNQYQENIQVLIENFPAVPIEKMGFPQNWKEYRF